MGRESRAKKNDPARAESIRAMREKAAELRMNLDRLMRTGQELADRAHYKKLGDERVTAGEALCDEIVAAEKAMRELLAQCFVVNLEFEFDSQALETEIAQLEGKPDPHAIDASVLHLPQEQADALRFAMEFAKARTPRPETEIEKSYERAESYLEHFRQLCARATTIALEMAEIGREKVRRGWSTAADIAPFLDGLDKNLGLIENGLASHTMKLHEAIAGRDKALTRRQDLTNALASLKR